MTAQGKARRRATPWVNRPAKCQALKGRNKTGPAPELIANPNCAALSGLERLFAWSPRAALVSLRLPWAVIFRAFSPRIGELPKIRAGGSEMAGASERSLPTGVTTLLRPRTGARRQFAAKAEALSLRSPLSALHIGMVGNFIRVSWPDGRRACPPGARG